MIKQRAKKGERKSPQLKPSTKPPVPSEFPHFSQVIKKLPSKFVDQESSSEGISQDKFIFNMQESLEFPSSPGKEGVMRLEEHQQGRVRESKQAKVSSHPDSVDSYQENIGNYSPAKKVITYSQLPFKNENDDTKIHNFDRKRISSCKGKKQHSINGQYLKAQNWIECSENSKEKDQEILRIQSQNDLIIQLLTQIKDGVKELLKIERNKYLTGGGAAEMFQQITRLLSELITMSKERNYTELSQKSKFPAPPRNTSSDYYNKVVEKYECVAARDSIVKSQQQKKEEEEDEELDRLILQSSIGGEFQSNIDPEQTGFSRAGTNSKIGMSPYKQERVEEYYKSEEGERRKREAEEDEKFYSLIKQAKENRKQAKFRPVKRTVHLTQERED